MIGRSAIIPVMSETPLKSRGSRFQLRLSTLLVIVAAVGVALAAWRLRPHDPVSISSHRIRFYYNDDLDRQAAAKSLYDMVKQSSLVGRSASTLDELFFANRIEVSSAHIRYTLDMNKSEEGQECVVLFVDTRTGIVTAAFISEYAL